MRDTIHSDAKQTQDQVPRIETDFGERKVSDQNFSRIIALPKDALANCGNPVKFNVKLVHENGARYIKLTPIQFKDTYEP